MAKRQPAACENAVVSSSRTVKPLPPITLFLRYLYTGSTSNSVPGKPLLSLHDIEARLPCVLQLAEARVQLPISTISKVSIFVCVHEIERMKKNEIKTQIHHFALLDFRSIK